MPSQSRGPTFLHRIEEVHHGCRMPPPTAWRRVALVCQRSPDLPQACTAVAQLASHLGSTLANLTDRTAKQAPHRRGVPLLRPLWDVSLLRQPLRDVTEAEPLRIQLPRPRRRHVDVADPLNLRMHTRRIVALALQDLSDDTAIPPLALLRRLALLVEHPSNLAEVVALPKQRYDIAQDLHFRRRLDQQSPSVCIEFVAMKIAKRGLPDSHTLRFEMLHRFLRPFSHQLALKLRIVGKVQHHHSTCRRMRIDHPAQRKQVIVLMREEPIDQRTKILN